MNESTNKLMNK